LLETNLIFDTKLILNKYLNMNQNPELVVLVDEQNNVLGTTPKQTVHTANTPLHRGFSAFIFDFEGKLLLQQRSHTKKTWPLVWSNSCCGHPGLEENNVDAARRRLKDELNLEVTDLFEVEPYRYKFTRDGVMENEICPILVGFTNNLPTPNPDEVEATKWQDWRVFIEEIKNNPQNWSDWCVEETLILEGSAKFKALWDEFIEMI
jgi:isopentenyl-diphosphate Delta-isomerase